MLLDAPSSWARMRISQRIGRGTPRLAVTEEHATIPLLGEGYVGLDREPLHAVYSTAARLTPTALIHPYLAPAAAVAAWWLGRESFHAGAVAVSGGAWGVLAAKGGGKSSLLGWLASAGYDVFTDDALIVDGGLAFAGPRSIDLRADAALHLGAGEPLGVVGDRERWRIGLQPCQAELPLLGWVFLEWTTGAIEIAALRSDERLRRLIGHRMLHTTATDDLKFLELAARPAVVLRRSRRWENLGESGARLLADLG